VAAEEEAVLAALDAWPELVAPVADAAVVGADVAAPAPQAASNGVARAKPPAAPSRPRTRRRCTFLLEPGTFTRWSSILYLGRRSIVHAYLACPDPRRVKEA